MAAPIKTAIGTPAGAPMGDGYQTRIVFAADTDVSLWEKTVQPPGVDGGDAVETTTMRNSNWRTMRPRNLKSLTEMRATCAYETDTLTDLNALINVETSITIEHPDGRVWAFYGYLRSFEPSDNEEGTQPEAEVIIQPTNWDPTNSVEAGPVVGTGTGV